MNGLRGMYQEIILDHAKHPAHRGAQAEYDAEVHHVNPTCGDEITLRVRLEDAAADGVSQAVSSDEAGLAAGGTSSVGGAGAASAAGGSASGPRLAEITWSGQGCSISQASASMMADAVDGRSVAEALELEGDFLELMNSRGVVPEHLEDVEALSEALALSGVAQYPARIKCALLGWMAMKDAVARAMAEREEHHE